MRASPGFGSFTFHIAKFAALCALVFACCDFSISRALGSDQESVQGSDADKAAYADALTYCRGNVLRPEALRADKRVLCLDGRISHGDELLLADGLQHGGIFVVRSEGGDIATTIMLAELLLLKEATVVINDYCLAVCADYLFIATAKTFVPKDAFVAWTVHVTAENNCIGFSNTPDPRAPRLEETPCAGSASFAAPSESLKRRFYYGRVVASPQQPPESVAIRKILKRKFDETGKYPDGVFWTWNPRFYASAINAKVVYEAYPQSQDEVDAIVRRLGLSFPVIYDP
jgi:hypothetical protein